MTKVELNDDNAYKVLDEIRDKLSNVLSVIIIFGDGKVDLTAAVSTTPSSRLVWPVMCEALESVLDIWEEALDRSVAAGMFDLDEKDIH